MSSPKLVSVTWRRSPCPDPVHPDASEPVTLIRTVPGETLRHDYEELGMSIRDLAEAYGMAPGTVRRDLISAGATLRARGGNNRGSGTGTQ